MSGERNGRDRTRTGPGGGNGAGRVERALALLTDEVRARLARHPQGHLMAGSAEELELALSLPAGGRRLAAEAERLAGEIGRAVDAALAHRAAFRPGRAHCLRCGGGDCDHAVPGGPREVFAGYGPTGVPRWLDYGQLLLERGDPRIDRLFGDPPALLAHTIPGADLSRGVLDAYRDAAAGFRLHGQVAAGWYRLPDRETGRPQPLAIALQVVSTAPAGRGRRFAVNVLGRGPSGEPLEHLFDALGDLPWLEASRWAQGELARLRRRPGELDHEVRRVLDGVARRIEKPVRAESRRTRHGRRRHAEGDRPTAQALADLERAGGDQLLVDTRRETLVVLGARGRAHLFSPAGKHVTSIRFDPAAIERRRDRRRWRPASRDEIEALRAAVGTGDVER